MALYQHTSADCWNKGYVKYTRTFILRSVKQIFPCLCCRVPSGTSHHSHCGRSGGRHRVDRPCPPAHLEAAHDHSWPPRICQVWEGKDECQVGHGKCITTAWASRELEVIGTRVTRAADESSMLESLTCSCCSTADSLQQRLEPIFKASLVFCLTDF